MYFPGPPPCSCWKKTQQNEALCYTGTNKKEIYSEMKQTLYVKSMQYLGTAKFESRKECTAFIEITLVSEGMQGELSTVLRNSIHGAVQCLLGFICFLDTQSKP